MGSDWGAKRPGCLEAWADRHEDGQGRRGPQAPLFPGREKQDGRTDARAR